MDNSGSESDTEYWIDRFLGAKGNEFFCEIDSVFIADRFNLTGLSAQVPHLQSTIDVITDKCGSVLDYEDMESLDESARLLYGLIHARYILTPIGLQKMLEKYQNFEFGKCPRVYCHLHPLLPIGLHDNPFRSTMKLYCAICEDIYVPKSSRHGTIDGAYFGTSFPGMFFQVYPSLIPIKSQEEFCLKLFGFKIFDQAKFARKMIDMEKLTSDERDGLNSSPPV